VFCHPFFHFLDNVVVGGIVEDRINNLFIFGKISSQITAQHSNFACYLETNMFVYFFFCECASALI
jgi:hypothetical protein